MAKSDDIAAMVFIAEMYGVQLDQLALVAGVSPDRARALAARWQRAGHVDSARLGPGASWFWATRAGLNACGMKYTATTPALSRLAHIRAVNAVRLALAGSDTFRDASAFWRSERRIRARRGVGVREHLPDAEVHWPDESAVTWAGECWAVEAELTPKTVARTAGIMREILTRTGDYGCLAADAFVPGRRVRHARALYVCAPAALSTVTRARHEIGAALGARIEIRVLPAGAVTG
jgi:hypothetical protein